MKKWLFLLVFMAVPCFAAEQGDFQIFKLGDTRDQVIQKIKEYQKQGKITYGHTNGECLTLRDGNLSVVFTYTKTDRLYQIGIGYPNGFKGLQEKRYIAGYLRDVLGEAYGPPVWPLGFPEKEYPGRRYVLCYWNKPNKTIDIHLTVSESMNSEVGVDIYDPKIKEEEDKDLIKDFG